MVLKDVRPIIAELVRLKKSIPLQIDVGRYLPDVRKNDHGEGVRSGIKKALRLIEQAPTIKVEPKWISVEERLPEDDDDVIIMTDSGVGLGYYSKCGYWVDYVNDNSGEPTHWMPLPEQPKEDDHGKTDAKP